MKLEGGLGAWERVVGVEDTDGYAVCCARCRGGAKRREAKPVSLAGEVSCAGG